MPKLLHRGPIPFLGPILSTLLTVAGLPLREHFSEGTPLKDGSIFSAE